MLHGAWDKAPQGSGIVSFCSFPSLSVPLFVMVYMYGIWILSFCEFTGNFATYLCFDKSLSLLKLM